MARRRVQPGAPAVHGDRHRAADRPGQRPRRPAPGRGDHPVLQQRQEHDRPAVAAPAGGHPHLQGDVGEDPGRRASRAPASGAGRRAPPAGGDPQERRPRRGGDAEARAERGVGGRAGPGALAADRGGHVLPHPRRHRARRRLRRGDAAPRRVPQARRRSPLIQRLGAAFRRSEDVVLLAALAAITILPLADALGRPLGGLHIPGGAGWVQQITLWLAFVGGLVATREEKHLTLSTTELFGPSVRRVGRVLAAAVAAATVAVLAYASVGVVLADREQGKVLSGGIPEWASECVMPVTLALIALRFAWRASERWA